eukprot:CAMPEP_0201575258 /NCGR_PEP_ID=MMETSP0190_2-20130828/20337_1 /ASSEMBLY_ACC=CAM_ASM_000263 /TAXON_ID=37353 /ORGANISM="Rosalina sp." /LENGTH=418 /DNA_ID=CAMNT_0048004651 /DNA_START=137 /DNA_END=1393 /DNA_ORIENTATION=+
MSSKPRSKAKKSKSKSKSKASRKVETPKEEPIENNDKDKQIEDMKKLLAEKDAKIKSMENQIQEQQEEGKGNDVEVEEKKEDNTKQGAINDYPELDLVFLMDCTGSMGSYIKKGKESIMNIVEKVKSSEKADVRFAYIAYRDHPPQDKTLITKVHKFTKKPQDMRNYLSKYKASGGGDGPEAVAEALYDAVNLTYRKNAIKIAVIIADAPPHGLGCSGDGFPNGNPNGHDPIKIANQMAELGIILYVVACEPSLSGFKGAHDFFEGIATITEGRYLPLTGAHLLPDVIIGGAKEEVSLQKLEQFVQNKMDKIKQENPTISVDEMNDKIKTEMQAYNMESYENEVEEEAIYGNYNRSNITAWGASTSLADGRSKQKKLAQPKANFSHKQKQKTKKSKMSKKKVGKMMNRVNKKSKNAYY